MSLFRSLQTLLNTYPTPLRASLLDHLHALLVETLSDEPEAVKLHATRWLPASGEAGVDQLRAANEALLEWARTRGGAVSGAYADVVEEWCQRDLDRHLVGRDFRPE